MTAVDVAPTMIRLATESDPDGEYLVSDAAALPFDDRTFDLVVAFNSLMDIDDMPGAVGEAARVLVPEGRFCVCITHPMRDAGHFEGATFVIPDGYLERRRFDLRIAKDGLEVHFRSWAYPLATYMGAIESAGFVVESLREPPDPNRPIPNFLLIRAVKSQSSL